MRTRKRRTIKKLPPNSNIVTVKENLCAKAKFYHVFNIDGYLEKCKQENKIAYFAGVSNGKGELVL